MDTVTGKYDRIQEESVMNLSRQSDRYKDNKTDSETDNKTNKRTDSET